jgi:hypothetical protein
MKRLAQGLAPRVEHGRHPDVAAEVTRIAAEAEERGRGAVGEEAIDQPRVTLRERVEGGGQGADDVEVGNGRRLGAPGGAPAFGVPRAFALGEAHREIRLDVVVRELIGRAR